MLSVIALVCSLSGNVLINYGHRIGFAVWFLANALWIAVNVTTHPNACQIAMFIVYMALNVHGWMKWRKAE